VVREAPLLLLYRLRLVKNNLNIKKLSAKNKAKFFFPSAGIGARLKQ
jgi:hypothetical protein